MLLLITPATRAQPYGEMLDSAAANSSVSTHASCLTNPLCVQDELVRAVLAAGLLRSPPSALWPLRPTAVSVRRLHILLSVLCSLEQARSSHHCTRTPTAH